MNTPDANPGFPDTEEPNTTQQTNRLLIKWKAWIATNTPIPTPSTSAYSSVVGLFQGAHYHPTNWYRPQLDCLMRDLYVPFCDVCSEALVLAIYQKVRPVDAFAPASTNLSVSTTAPVTFSLTLLQPATHSLSVQWYTNNTAVAGATNSALTLSPTALGNGTHTVSAAVRDDTSLVRNDPDESPDSNGDLGREREPATTAPRFSAVADRREIRLPNRREWLPGRGRPEFYESVELG